MLFSFRKKTGKLCRGVQKKPKQDEENVAPTAPDLTSFATKLSSTIVITPTACSDSSEEDIQKKFKRSCGHVYGDECKWRRKKHHRKQKKKKRKQRRLEASADGPRKVATDVTRRYGEPEEQEAPLPPLSAVPHESSCSEPSWLSMSATSTTSALSKTESSLVSSTDASDLISLTQSLPTIQSVPLSFDDDEVSLSSHSAEFSIGSQPRRNTITGASSISSSSSSSTLSSNHNKGVLLSPSSSSPLDFLVGVHVPASIGNIGEARLVEVRHVHMLFNPWSGNKKGETKMRKARQLLERAGKEVTVTKLLHKGHAAELCATMDFTGIDVLVSVGGDGTFHECVNGLMNRTNKQNSHTWDEKKDDHASSTSHSEEDEGEKGPAARIPPLAFIAAGTGNSFVHELGCSRIQDSVQHIIRGIEVGVDLGRVTCGDKVCYSFNSIHWGIGSRVVDTAERFRWMGNSVRYTMAAVVELLKGNHGRVRIMITDENDEEIVWDDPYALGIANNIITASKGMKMAPTAKMDDGLIDLLLFTSRTPKDLLSVLRKFYNGTHTKLPHVRYVKAKKFTVIPYTTSSAGETEHTDHEQDTSVAEDLRSEDLDHEPHEGSAEELFDNKDVKILTEVIDIDGELKGFTPFTCEVVPGAVQVIV